MKDFQKVTLREKLNLETSRIRWRELQPFFARGQVVRVANSLDLVYVAEKMSEDDKEVIEQWMKQGELAVVEDDLALGWFEENKEFWAVVVKPWVLIQEFNNATDNSETGSD